MLRSRRGSSLLEFSLIGIPVLFMVLSVFGISLAMWQYHTMEEAVQVGARYTVTHGSGCNCAVTVGNIATVVKNAATGMSTAGLNLVLISSGGTTISCTVSNCMTGGNAATVFPPTADSGAGSKVTLKLTSTISNPVMMFWPGRANVVGGNFALGAQSVQEILY